MRATLRMRAQIMSEKLEARSLNPKLDFGDDESVRSAYPSATIFGSSHPMVTLDREITRVANSRHIVLITGECGTGKTTAAQMIHDRSHRAQAPFIDVNCAALPDTLVESELFGYERGAFTGAVSQKKGLFETAQNGTLFLDEIGDLKLDFQAKLLKAIEQKKIRRLGGTQDIYCNVRILAASSQSLQKMVKTGTFREDLYYRLAVLEILVPPLRDRKDDIPELIRQQLIVEQTNAALSRPFNLDSQALIELTNYSWPGNIRQLHNVIARLTFRAIPSQAVTANDVHAEISRLQYLDRDNILLPATCSIILAEESLEEFTVRVRTAAIESVKACLGGNMSHVARRLKVDRSGLMRIVQRLYAFDTSKSTRKKNSAIAA
jgi:transcriptional regulator with PAS, ATPase and Fis domain